MSRPRSWRRLRADFFARGTEDVARALLGTILVHGRGADACAGRIVETEAYLGAIDEAAHSFRGRTQRNASMFGAAGRAYVYRIYGMHVCFNVVTEGVGRGEAVLVRALEPLHGVELMRARRGVAAERELCRGPGRLTQALDIELEHDGLSLLRGPLALWSDGVEHGEHAIAATPRIGITRAAARPLRFVVRGSRWISGRPVE